MAKAPNWTSKELQILRDVYTTEGCQSNLLKLLPGRSSKGISVKASKLGIKVLNPWNKLLSTEEYNLKIIEYNLTTSEPYINDRTEILHTCLNCRTTWKVRPNNILNGHGCPTCRKCYGFQQNNTVDLASIYLIEIRLNTSEHFLKVGVTSNPTSLRFVNIKSEIGSDKIETFNVLLRRYSTGSVVTELESNILRNSELTRHTTDLRFRGYTELFEFSELDKILHIIDITIPEVELTKP